MRLIVTTALAAALSFPVQAFDWPWQNRQTVDYSFCKGFVYAGLGSVPVENLSRIQLWLAWNEVVKLTPTAFDTQDAQYLEGRSFFN